MANPTLDSYFTMTDAYDFFNDRLFDNALPPCLITFQRKSNTRGYFSGDRFQASSSEDKTDEIAMNPQTFEGRTTKEVLSTLVHEMVHLWQHHYGNPGRSSYHNREWANAMIQIGLIPTDTGEIGGRQTGQKVTHVIEENGLFSEHADELLDDGFEIPYYDATQPSSGRKSASKTKYTCGGCGQNAWAKPDAALMCGDCGVLMEPNQ
jgi:predicted SprT family Zn-dependent metalloprotease